MGGAGHLRLLMSSGIVAPMSQNGREPQHGWRGWLPWLALATLLYGGATVLVSVLHPEGKHDPKGIPLALFALATVVIGIAVITYVQRPKG